MVLVVIACFKYVESGRLNVEEQVDLVRATIIIPKSSPPRIMPCPVPAINDDTVAAYKLWSDWGLNPGLLDIYTRCSSN